MCSFAAAAHTKNSPNVGEVAALQARLARLEPLAKRVDEVETALVAHAKSNRDKFDVSLPCLGCPFCMHVCIPYTARPPMHCA